MKVYLINTVEDFSKYYPLLYTLSEYKLNSQSFHVVGFDTEYKSDYECIDALREECKWIKHGNMKVGICTVQIAVNDTVFILNFSGGQLPITNKIRKIFTSEKWLKVGVGIDYDMTILSDNFNLGHCCGSFDIKNLAYLAGLEKQNLAYLSDVLLGIKLDKNTIKGDWSKELSMNMIQYAGMDAIVSHMLYIKIMRPAINALKMEIKRKEDLKKVFIMNESYINNKKQESSKINKEKGTINTKEINEKVMIEESDEEEYSITEDEYIISEEGKEGKEEKEEKEEKEDEIYNYITSINNYAQKFGYDLPEYYQIKNNGSTITTCYFGEHIIVSSGSNNKESKYNCAKKMHTHIEKYNIFTRDNIEDISDKNYKLKCKCKSDIFEHKYVVQRYNEKIKELCKKLKYKEPVYTYKDGNIKMHIKDDECKDYSLKIDIKCIGRNILAKQFYDIMNVR